MSPPAKEVEGLAISIEPEIELNAEEGFIDDLDIELLMEESNEDELADIVDATEDEEGDRIAGEKAYETAAVSPPGETILKLLLEEIETRFGKSKAETWRTSVQSHCCTAEQMSNERRRARERLNWYRQEFKTVGATFPGMVIPNGCRQSAVAMVAFWPPLHKGSHVIYRENYTMSGFYNKGYTGATSKQAAFDSVDIKCMSQQHQSLPKWSRDHDKFISQFQFFSYDNATEKDKADVHKNCVEKSLDELRGIVSASCQFACFRFCQGGPPKNLCWKYIEDFCQITPEYTYRDSSINIAVPPLPHLSIPVKTAATQTPTRMVLRGGQVLGIFLAVPHASAISYAGKSGEGENLRFFEMGLKLDAVTNLAIHLSGSKTSAWQQSLFLSKYWPNPGASDPRRLTRTLVYFRGKEKVAKGKFVFDKDSLPPFLVKQIEAECLDLTIPGEDIKETWLAQVLSRRIKQGLSRMTEDQKLLHKKHLVEARAKWSPEKIAIEAEKRRRSMLARTPQQKAASEAQRQATLAARTPAQLDAARLNQLRAREIARNTRLQDLAGSLDIRDASFVRYEILETSNLFELRVLGTYQEPPMAVKRLQGLTVPVDIFQRLLYLIDPATSKTKTAMVMKNRRDLTCSLEPWYCSARHLVYCKWTFRNLENDIRLSKAGVVCSLCEKGDLSACTIRTGSGAAVRRRNSCAPILAFNRVLKGDMTPEERDARRGPVVRLETAQIQKALHKIDIHPGVSAEAALGTQRQGGSKYPSVLALLGEESSAYRGKHASQAEWLISESQKLQ